jgi:hypothetical protein
MLEEILVSRVREVFTVVCGDDRRDRSIRVGLHVFDSLSDATV